MPLHLVPTLFSYLDHRFPRLLLISSVVLSVMSLVQNLWSCLRLATELENDASLDTLSAEEVQNAAKLEADSSQDLQDKMQALQHQVNTALTELRSRSQQSLNERRPVSQLKVC